MNIKIVDVEIIGVGMGIATTGMGAYRAAKKISK
jgi:hypothetical protein